MEPAQYYSEFAAAFVRSRLSVPSEMKPEETIDFGLKQGLRLRNFKQSAALPRVRRTLGILKGLHPQSLVDIGSGRGVFLWSLMEAFPGLPVTAVERDWKNAADLGAVRKGGIVNLNPVCADACQTGLKPGCCDVVTILEVLEHLEHPDLASKEAIRLARRFVLASVPSKPDRNPEHLRLFDKASLTRLFLEAGAKTVKVSYVLNHIIAVAGV